MDVKLTYNRDYIDLFSDKAQYLRVRWLNYNEFIRTCLSLNCRLVKDVQLHCASVCTVKKC